MLGDPQAKRGRSNTCRASTPATGASASPAPHSPHRSGRCSTTWSGVATWARWAPGAPGCLPGRRRAAPSSSWRPARARLRTPSEDGGLEELEESFPRRPSSSATRACSVAIRRACSVLAARSSAMTAACTAMVASRSPSGEEITTSRTRAVTPACPRAVGEQLSHKPQTVNSFTTRGRRAPSWRQRDDVRWPLLRSIRWLRAGQLPAQPCCTGSSFEEGRSWTRREQAGRTCRATASSAPPRAAACCRGRGRSSGSSQHATTGSQAAGRTGGHTSCRL
jgi:hypothetical protein